MLSDPSTASTRPPQKPRICSDCVNSLGGDRSLTWPPMLRMAALPASTNRSPQDSPGPCFSLVGCSSARA